MSAAHIPDPCTVSMCVCNRRDRSSKASASHPQQELRRRSLESNLWTSRSRLPGCLLLLCRHAYQDTPICTAHTDRKETMLRRRHRRRHMEHRSSSSVSGCPVNRTLSACLRGLSSDKTRISGGSTTMSEDPMEMSSELSATHPRSATQEQPSTTARRVRAATDRDHHLLWDSVWHTSRPEECWRSYRYRRDPSAPMSTTVSGCRLLCTM